MIDVKETLNLHRSVWRWQNAPQTNSLMFVPVAPM